MKFTKDPLLISHRGNNISNVKENTLDAFKEAVKESNYAIELDVMISKDNKILISHNTVDNKTGELYNYYTIQQLKEKKIDLEFEEVIKTLPHNTNYLIDIKESRPDSKIVLVLLTLCLKYNIVSNCIFASFNEYILRDLYEYELEFDIYLKKGYITANIEINFIYEKILLWNISHIIFEKNLISSDMIKYLKDNFDIQIFIYTCNDIGYYYYAKGLHIDGIITDKSHIFKDIDSKKNNNLFHKFIGLFDDICIK